MGLGVWGFGGLVKRFGIAKSEGLRSGFTTCVC